MAKVKKNKKRLTVEPDKLNYKQEAFCREFIIDKNRTEACIRAGYSKKSARAIGSQLYAKLNIRKRIDILFEERQREAMLTPQMVVQELRNLAEWSIQDYLDDNNSVKDLSTLPRHLLKPIAGIKSTTTILPDGSKQVKTELKLTDKRATWVDLGRHTGIFKEDNEQSAIKIKVTRK